MGSRVKENNFGFEHQVQKEDFLIWAPGSKGRILALGSRFSGKDLGFGLLAQKEGGRRSLIFFVAECVPLRAFGHCVTSFRNDNADISVKNKA